MSQSFGVDRVRAVVMLMRSGKSTLIRKLLESQSIEVIEERNVGVQENKWEIGYREGEKISKGERKLRKVKRGW